MHTHNCVWCFLECNTCVVAFVQHYFGCLECVRECADCSALFEQFRSLLRAARARNTPVSGVSPVSSNSVVESSSESESDDETESTGYADVSDLDAEDDSSDGRNADDARASHTPATLTNAYIKTATTVPQQVVAPPMTCATYRLIFEVEGSKYPPRYFPGLTPVEAREDGYDGDIEEEDGDDDDD